MVFPLSNRPGRRSSAFAFVLVLACLVLVASAACSGDDATATPTPPAKASATTSARAGASPSAAAAFPYTVTDSGGTAITVSEAPKRIISYSPGATEVLFAVGAGAQVVGVDKFADYPPETSTKAKLEYSKPAPEPALALQPDLVIMATRQEGQVKQFRDLGMRVVLFKEPTDLAGVLSQIGAISHLTGHGSEGDRLVAGLQGRIDAVRSRLANVPNGPVVFYEVTPDLYSAGPDTFIGALLTTVKAKNVAAGAATAFPQLSPETIIAANPAVILLSDGSDSGGQSLETVKARPGWGGLEAVKSGRVYVVDSAAFSRPGPRVVDALEQLAKLLYPELK